MISIRHSKYTDDTIAQWISNVPKISEIESPIYLASISILYSNSDNLHHFAMISLVGIHIDSPDARGQYI